MPQRSLHPVVYIMLMWLTIISIIQVVFIIFFFTMGEKPQSSDRRIAAGGMSEPWSTSPPTTPNPMEHNNTMVTFQATKVNTAIYWTEITPHQKLVSVKNEILEIMRDGYYFLNLKVTLCDGTSTNCNHSERVVTLKNDNKVMLEGRIDTKTKTTGQLSKVYALSAGMKLQVTIEPKTESLNKTEFATHLDIIFMNMNKN